MAAVEAANTYAFGRFVWRPAQRLLLVDGRPATLGARALDLLAALIELRGATVTKQELLDQVWHGLVVEEANLHVQVSALRKVLGSGVIATVPGRGYRFVAALDDEPAREHAVSPMPVASPAPSPLELLIGREAALAELAASLIPGALVTVVGPAGVGKTTLARSVAAAGAWRDGVAWVDCGAIHDPSEIAASVAQAAGVQQRGRLAPEAMARALGGRSLLVVLDNGEHVREGAAEVAAALRGRAVCVLVTSQAPLNAPGERLLRLGPLALPEVDEDADERCPAIALFAERARGVERAFAVDRRNAALVARICRQLDGLPLAIELAAARVRLLGLQVLAERLDERLRLLGTTSRGDVRQRTLRAALDWSVSLLGPQERAVLRRLGVFAGGFTLELAQEVAADPPGGELDPWRVLDALGELVDRSLVTVSGDDRVRYGLLETMRLHALEALEAAGETASVRARHAQAVTAAFVAADASSFGQGAGPAGHDTARLLAETDNARAALRWLCGDGGDAATAIALAGSAAGVMHVRGLEHEWIPAMRALLDRVDEATPVARINLRWRLATLGRLDNMPSDALYRLKQLAVAEARACGLTRRLQPLLGSLGYSQAEHGELDAARATVAEMQALHQPGDPPIFTVVRLGVQVKVQEAQGDLEGVVATLRQMQVLSLASGDTANLRVTEFNLCLFLNALGRHEEVVAIAQAQLAQADASPRTTHFAFVLIAALVALGRTEAALRVGRERRADFERQHAAVDLQGREALALLAAARGRLDDAVRIAAPCVSGPGAAPGPLARAALARVDQACADAGIAPELVMRWREEGRALPAVAAVGLALR